MKTRKKLIEVALPLDAINKASAREKSIRHGHPSTLHLWWARRPLAAARAVIFSQMVDDPSACPEEFPTEEAQEKERQRLFRLIEELVTWENTTNERVLNRAREEIKRSWRRACADNADQPQAAELFNPDKLPAFHDPFAGGGALPLEAQRLGLEAYASDLNPVAVLINKAMIEIPPKFSGRPPVNPEARKQRDLLEKEWRGAEGLAEDVRFYGKWMRDEAEKRIGHLYPKIEVTTEMVNERPDLEHYVGRELTVIAWLWARTVKSPNPAFAEVDVPLAATFILSSKKGKEAYVEPVIENGNYRFTVKAGKPRDADAAKSGTKLSRGAFMCLMSGSPFPYSYIDGEANAGRMDARLMAVVAEGDRMRVYLPPTKDMEQIARSQNPKWKPDTPSRGTWGSNAQGRIYGFKTFGDYFTPRQLMALTTLSDLIQEARERVRRDAIASGLPDIDTPLRDGGTGATSFADAVGVYLAFAIDKGSVYWSNLCPWLNQPKNEIVGNTFGRQGLAMMWDFAESNPFSNSGGNFGKQLDYVSTAIAHSLSGYTPGVASQNDAARQDLSRDRLVSTDPPYYDNIAYADLSEFFYAWLRHSLQPSLPDLFATIAVPKAEELVAATYRHGSKEKAAAFFLNGMTQAMQCISEQAHSAFPVTIYYAFKQTESDGLEGTANTGWETFLDAVIRSGFAITGTWPMRTERPTALKTGTNALASSIVLVCRPRTPDTPTVTRREFISSLKAELPGALAHLQRGNIAPVDLAQAAIGPGMAVFSRYTEVLEADDSPMTVRSALQLINQVVDEVFSEEEQDYDPDTRFAVTWYETRAFEEGAFGEAETLAKARGVAVSGVQEAGLLKSAAGKVRLLTRAELPGDWDPEADGRLTVWEATQHLIKRLEERGESEAATLLTRLGTTAEQARSLAYRLYTTCERKKWAEEAQAYNGLVLAWPELEKLASEAGPSAEPETQAGLFEAGE